MEVQWALVLFTVVSGAGAWLFASAMLGALLKKGDDPTKLETVLSFVLMVVGGCISVLHLSHVDRILEALNRPTSGIFVEAAMIGVTCAILAVYFIMLVRGSSQKARRVVGIFGMVVAVVFTYACGSSYMMAARPAWMSIALPLAYCATAAAAGTGLHLLCKGLQKASDESAGFAGTLAGIGAAFGAVASAAFCVHAGSYLAAAENGAVTSVVILFVCLVAEILCGVGALKKPANATAFGAAAVVLGVAAAIALRVAMWQIGTPSMDFFLVPLA